ncbi:glycine/sarcosine/betaine reductase component B subunit alpha and beta [Methylocaldum marinum]|uniref:Glycine/sarcosine/betaine reductase component B subunit alpha and beta n=1 Tax=Methylocaldum marinum TaxID=1432792 RepID=A0A250KQM0_9GAMM|nr:glycine/sarcosine/betaine reductase component B subunit alpha and beta [Methylocaldum marinum]
MKPTRNVVGAGLASAAVLLLDRCVSGPNMTRLPAGAISTPGNKCAAAAKAERDRYDCLRAARARSVV